MTNILTDGQLHILTLESLAEGTEDFIGLWQLPNDISHLTGCQARKESHQAVLELVAHWIENDLLRPGGFFLNVEFVPGITKGHWTLWNLSPIEELKRIRDLWHDPEYSPEIGDDIWFEITPAGERYLERYRNKIY